MRNVTSSLSLNLSWDPICDIMFQQAVLLFVAMTQIVVPQTWQLDTVENLVNHLTYLLKEKLSIWNIPTNLFFFLLS